MILQKIILHPFGGFAHREIEFKPGLNVIYGSNDVGKSTLFRAIECAFFLPTKLRTNTIEGRDLKRLIPMGGDHAKVTLYFQKQGHAYCLEKTWGSSASSKLILHNGAVLTSPEKVENELHQLIPVPPGTFRSVLLTSQNALHKTVDELVKNTEIIHTFGDALRLTLNQTDGFSIDRFKSLLQQQHEELFLNWDITTQSPKKSRGIENPWDRQGKILRAYYSKELLRKKLNETQTLETLLGDQNRILSEKLKLLKEYRSFLQNNEKIIESASTKQNLEIQLEQNKRTTLQLTQDFTHWIQAESDRKNFEPEILRLDSVVQTFQQELKEARAELDRRKFITHFEKIEAARRNLEELRNKLNETKSLPIEGLIQLQEHAHTIEKSKATLSAAQLQVYFTARTEFRFTIKRDFDPEKKETLSTDQSITLKAGGKIHLSSDFFDFTVTSGDGKIEKIENQLNNAKNQITELFKRFDIKSIEEAYELHEKSKQLFNQVQTAEISLQTLLSGENYESLLQHYQQIKLSLPCRDPELVEKDIQVAHQLLVTRKTDLASCSRSIQELQRRYQVNESHHLTEFIIQKRVEEQEWTKKLATLPTLPPEMGDLNQLLEHFKHAKENISVLSDEIIELTRVITEIKARLPDRSAQDFDRELRDATKVFEHEIKIGNALLRIESTTQIIEEQKVDIFSEFQTQLDQNFDHLSQGKYQKSKTTESIPREFVRKDGVSLPYHWLSTGTQDAFAMSLRLMMAEYFLKDSQGFTLMDDPMVAMDPERQKIAAHLLIQFAEKSQMILFSCHPSHVKLWEGNLITLT